MGTDSASLPEPPLIDTVEVPFDRGAAAGKISQAIVAIHSKHYGRGPTRAKTVWTEEFIVTTLEDIYTPAERTLIGANRFEDVRNMRLAFQLEMEAAFVAAVEEIVGRKVRAFLSQVHADPPVATEIFILEPRAPSAMTGV